jgi:hypothetical protein
MPEEYMPPEGYEYVPPEGYMPPEGYTPPEGYMPPDEYMQQMPEPEIAVSLHAVWDPDLTDDKPHVCTTSGTVSAPWFHFWAGWKGELPAFFVIDQVELREMSEHEPQVLYLRHYELEDKSNCTLAPSVEGEWNWTLFRIGPSQERFFMHNSDYEVTVRWRYLVSMKGERGPYQTSIRINVKNLVVTSQDVGKVLRWDFERGIRDTSFSYKIECAQRKEVEVRIRIYDMGGNLVYEWRERKICPWNLLLHMGWDG